MAKYILLFLLVLRIFLISDNTDLLSIAKLWRRKCLKLTCQTNNWPHVGASIT